MISSSLVTLMSPSSETLLGGKALGAAVASHGFGMSWGRMDTRMGLSAFLIVSWTSYHNCKKHQASCWKLSWTLAEVLHPAGLLIFLSSIPFNPSVLFRTTYIFTYNLRFQCSQVWFFFVFVAMTLIAYLLFSLTVCEWQMIVSCSPFIFRCLSLDFMPVRLILALQSNFCLLEMCLFETDREK